jgi:3-deoxy-D-manno-octulosonic acid (KDO) 8-phosphate synthase
VLNYRFHTASLIFFFSLLGPLDVLGACFSEHEISAEDTSQIPNSISCVDDNEAIPFLYQTSFPKTEKRALDAYRFVSLQERLSSRALLHAAGGVFVLFSVPIYQSKTVYRI